MELCRSSGTNKEAVLLVKVDGTVGNFREIGTAIFPVGERWRIRLDKSVELDSSQSLG